MAQNTPIALLTEAGADETGNSHGLPRGQTPQDRFYTFYGWGTFGGATLKLQVKPPGTVEWFDTGAELTDRGAVNVEAKAGSVRAVTVGGTGSTEVNALLV